MRGKGGREGGTTEDSTGEEHIRGGPLEGGEVLGIMGLLLCCYVMYLLPRLRHRAVEVVEALCEMLSGGRG